MLKFTVNILSTPAVFVGPISSLGLALQRKPIEGVTKRTVKTIIGFLVLSTGAPFLQPGSLDAFGDSFSYTFSMQEVVPNGEAIVSLALKDSTTDTTYIICPGTVFNIIMARFSGIHCIFLAGHRTFYMACMLTIILNVGGLTSQQLQLGDGFLSGFIMIFSPAFCRSTMRRITRADELGFGYLGDTGCQFAAQCRKLLKDRGKSTEEVSFPQCLTFLRDTTVAIGPTMVIFLLIVTTVTVSKGILSADAAAISKKCPSPIGLLNVGAETKTHWTVQVITGGLGFTGGVYIILSDVRLIVGGIVPTFCNIAERLVPDTVSAIDCPAIFPYVLNAVLIGSLVSFPGSIVGLFILEFIDTSLTSVALILPGVIPRFFCGVTTGVFGNAEGGLKGCVLGNFMHGLLTTSPPAICMPVMGSLNFANCALSDADFSWMRIAFRNITQVVQGVGLLDVCAAVFLIPIICNCVTPKKVKKAE